MNRISLIAFLAATLTPHIAAQSPFYLSPVQIEPLLSAGKCLQPANGANTDGTQVQIVDCTGASEQQWTFSGGQVKVFGNKCLDVPGGSATLGVKLQIWTCSAGNPNQQWYYTGDKHLAWTNHALCLDLSGGSLANGNPVQLWNCDGGNPNQVWDTGYSINALPQVSEAGQTGFNNCPQGSSSQTSNCQTLWINSLDDFCLFAPPNPNSLIGDTEREEVTWCTKSGHGTRVMPPGTITGAHFIKTPDYVQITGVGDLTKINIRPGDDGGELDPHGADGNGNPIGGLVFGNSFGQNFQYHEWTEFISSGIYCIRACVGANAARNCQHIYDVMGCGWNMPSRYEQGLFDSCDGDDTEPMGVYGSSTWYQGVSPTPSAHNPGPSSNCVFTNTVGGGTPTTTSPPAPTGVSIHPNASGSKCLQPVADADGAAVVVQDCNGSNAQTWINTGNTLRTPSGRCLDVPSGQTQNGVKLQIWTCFSGNANQQFTYTSNDGHITWNGHGSCVDLTSGSLTNNNPAQMWTCFAGNNNQKWNLS